MKALLSVEVLGSSMVVVTAARAGIACVVSKDSYDVLADLRDLVEAEVKATNSARSAIERSEIGEAT